jgi:hypothetical protein
MKEFSISPWKTAHAWSNTGYIRTIKDAQGEHIAHVCDLDDALTKATANARLLAAAPDLLAALQNLIAAIEASDAGWLGIDAFPEDFERVLATATQ